MFRKMLVVVVAAMSAACGAADGQPVVDTDTEWPEVVASAGGTTSTGGAATVVASGGHAVVAAGGAAAASIVTNDGREWLCRSDTDGVSTRCECHLADAVPTGTVWEPTRCEKATCCYYYGPEQDICHCVTGQDLLGGGGCDEYIERIGRNGVPVEKTSGCVY